MLYAFILTLFVQFIIVVPLASIVPPTIPPASQLEFISPVTVRSDIQDFPVILPNNPLSSSSPKLFIYK